MKKSNSLTFSHFQKIPSFRGVFKDSNLLCLCSKYNLSPKVTCIPACSTAQSCPTLCNPMDCSPPGFSIHEILQARIVQWAAISSSRRSLKPRDQTWISCISCIYLGSPRSSLDLCWVFYWVIQLLWAALGGQFQPLKDKYLLVLVEIQFQFSEFLE